MQDIQGAPALQVHECSKEPKTELNEKNILFNALSGRREEKVKIENLRDGRTGILHIWILRGCY